MIYGEDVRRIFEPATRCESRAHSSEELAERGGGAEERTERQKNGMQMHLAGKWHKCHHREGGGGGGREWLSRGDGGEIERLCAFKMKKRQT